MLPDVHWESIEMNDSELFVDYLYRAFPNIEGLIQNSKVILSELDEFLNWTKMKKFYRLEMKELMYRKKDRASYGKNSDACEAWDKRLEEET